MSEANKWHVKGYAGWNDYDGPADDNIDYHLTLDKSVTENEVYALLNERYKNKRVTAFHVQKIAGTDRESATIPEEWLYVKPLKSADLVAEYETLTGYVFCESFKKCVIANNGGRPNKRVFRTSKGRIREIKSLLSFNKDDKETIWQACEWDKGSSNKYVPFAVDNFGNVICFDVDDSKVVFVNHEDMLIETIADNFDTFLAELREEIQ